MPSPNLSRDNFHNVLQQSYDEKDFRGDYDGTNLIYAGFALPGTDESVRSWQIKQLNYTGSNLVSVKWPQYNGLASTAYNFAWADRASYTYG
jgi:hypothetical protein